MRKQTKRVLSVIGVTAILVGGASAAYAYWTASGTGTGSGATGTSLAVNVVQTIDITNLRPGGAAQSVHGVFDNLNAAPTYVSTVTASITSISGNPGTCTAADYTLANAVMTINATVDDGTTWSGATLAFNNTGSNQDGCKGATVNLGFVVA